jgi:hypothetical protein
MDISLGLRRLVGSHLPFEHGVLGKKTYFRFRLLQHTEQHGGRRQEQVRYSLKNKGSVEVFFTFLT